MIRPLASFVRRLLEHFLIGGVRCYQLLIRPIMPAVCRFSPSCSEYFIEAVRKYGPIRGAGKGIWRLCRCNPLGRGGYDPP